MCSTKKLKRSLHHSSLYTPSGLNYAPGGNNGESSIYNMASHDLNQYKTTF